MSNFTESAPHLLAMGSGTWLDQVQDAASELGVVVETVSSFEAIYSKAKGLTSGLAIFIDGRSANLDWAAVHQRMLDEKIDCSVTIVAEAALQQVLQERVSKYKHRILTIPASDRVFVEALKRALEHQRLEQRFYCVERSHQKVQALEPREREILGLAAEGAPNKQIAKKFELHIKSIERIRKVGYRKLQVNSVAQMTRVFAWAEMYELLFPPPDSSYGAA